jgi:two-component system, LytTR family, response regulator
MVLSLSYAPETAQYLPGGSLHPAPIVPDPTREMYRHTDDRPSKIMLPTMEGFCFEKVKHIAFLEAGGNYTTLHFTDKRQILVCKTLREVEMMLPENSFVRIHRSHTVHLRHLKKYIRGKGGQVMLQNGVYLTVSAGQREELTEALKNYFQACPS